ncbi:glycosyltransferase [Cellulosimicrobium cellulans]|uniref:glycosyltransferase n=1 Tax=Cellulosimicrobium cellulans TaxID=1710 RepID=UPI002096E985|nr:glycosyltransferase [Cellulosimicrobium cellulans]MCO7271582.1 glycosyltransferase [Cellulosimicrobium cellulans]
MRVLLVIDQFEDPTNGTTISARRFAVALRERGHEVRVACCRGAVRPGDAAHETSADDVVHYRLEALGVPGFNRVIAGQGWVLAQPDDDVLRDALGWADVAHVMSPFWLGSRAKRLADALGVPSTAAFHVQPENVTYSLGLGRVAPLNDLVYAVFRPFYDRFGHVHCPSRFIAGELRDHRYRATLHVVSNGVDPGFVPRTVPKSADLTGRFVITMTGRLSREKRQDVLLDAVGRSRHADCIQLVLAGRGPLAERYAQQGASLPHPPRIGFLAQDELRDVLAMSDLYVHAADAEIEALGCLEAVATGLVPVISDSRASATGQFALDERSLFRAGDAADLARAIDYWIEHDEERTRMGAAYAAVGREHALDVCVPQIEEMLRQAVLEGGGAVGPAPVDRDDAEDRAPGRSHER